MAAVDGLATRQVGVGGKAQGARREVRVHHHDALGIAAREAFDQGRHGFGLTRLACGDHACKLGLGDFIDFANGRAGQDVMEFIPQKDVPIRL